MTIENRTSVRDEESTRYVRDEESTRAEFSTPFCSDMQEIVYGDEIHSLQPHAIMNSDILFTNEEKYG